MAGVVSAERAQGPAAGLPVPFAAPWPLGGCPHGQRRWGWLQVLSSPQGCSDFAGCTLPSHTMGILLFCTGTIWTRSLCLLSFRTPLKWSDWVTWTQEGKEELQAFFRSYLVLLIWQRGSVFSAWRLKWTEKSQLMFQHAPHELRQRATSQGWAGPEERSSSLPASPVSAHTPGKPLGLGLASGSYIRAAGAAAQLGLSGGCIPPAALASQPEKGSISCCCPASGSLPFFFGFMLESVLQPDCSYKAKQHCCLQR